jgi:hypothetical protein
MVLTTRVSDGPNPPWRSPLLPRRVYRRESYHGDYVFSCAGVAMSGGDEMDSSSQVHIVRCTWVPVALSYHARHSMLLSPEVPTHVALLGTQNPSAQLPGAWVYSELGDVEVLLWADRW